MAELRLVRRVPPGRRAVTRRALGTAPLDKLLSDGTEWWELIDPADDDERPAAAVAAVRPDGTIVRLVGIATPPGRSDLAVQVLIALVDALRATAARRLVAAPPAHGEELLRQAGFGPYEDGSYAVEL
ncbi:hypothetical protein Drose_22175 [Dactylosporangium roseum]|uniref:N-acetyltransferase domain-containing protein n=1 Tax=Dactylosporangium roseum TaxID=47989 RepID=A0ABY5YW46_9ACTN|nr:hypothetical protein [Dactylosporangium roseum]UWZ33970.1 hypothetical protein Drose_22175 [Dactylosporangium roseum]